MAPSWLELARKGALLVSGLLKIEILPFSGVRSRIFNH
jgi:hypothetical protein